MAKSVFPEPGVDYPTTYQDLLAWFPTDDTLEYERAAHRDAA